MLTKKTIFTKGILTLQLFAVKENHCLLRTNNKYALKINIRKGGHGVTVVSRSIKNL